jgi:hypothetical protein
MMNAVYDGGLDDIKKEKKIEQVTPSSKYQCPSQGKTKKKREERQENLI